MFLQRKTIAQPTVSDQEVGQFIRRFSGFESTDCECLVASDAEEATAAVPGPDAFSIEAVRVRQGSPLRIEGNERYRVVQVVRGAIQTDTAQRLALRDAMLLPPRESRVITALEHEATVLVVSYRERDRDGHWVDGARREGLSRWRSITPVRHRFPVNLAPRLNAILSPRDLYPLVGPMGRGPGAFDIRGPEGLVVAMATTPRFTGPALHVHTLSTEIFVVLEGQFRISWGERGEHEAILGPLDVIAVPLGINRAFEAYGEGENWILPVVVGANDETEDIAWLPAVKRTLFEAGPRWLAYIATQTKLQIRSRS